VLVATAMIGLGWALAGCDSANKVNVSPPKEEEQHAHVHHGPRGGHLMEIGEEEFHAEWTDDESGKVTFYFLDGEAKKEVAVEGEEITIEVRIGDKEPVLYKLAAIEPKEGKATAYELVDKNLQGVLDQLGRGVSATFPKLTIAGKAFENLKIEEHKHEEHKHEEEQKK
jgi:hypothetical protein